MRYIEKSAEPAAFVAWKAGANADWTPTYRDLRDPEKRELHEALLAEQGGTCCYCGRLINRDDSHIEHFAPQEAFDSKALDHANLHASCIRELAPGNPLHCGHGKANEFDAAVAIKPTDPLCEARFSYSKFTGAVVASDARDRAANYMIGLLKLDIEFLRERRAEALEGMFDDVFEASATIEELQLLAQRMRQRTATGHYRSFSHVLALYAEHLIALKR